MIHILGGSRPERTYTALTMKKGINKGVLGCHHRL
jgi:hypothetical protein